MSPYSSEMKEAMVAKLCGPGAPSAAQLSKKTGISQTALSRWVREMSGGSKMKSRRPEDWSPKERLMAVFESLSLSDKDLGEFLRKKGLHSNHIEEWKKEAISDAAGKKKVGRPRKDPELVAVEEENKILKRELRRKDMALAEQTALVVLQKKARILWGQDGDEE